MTEFPEGIDWRPGGQVVPEMHKITFKGEVVEGGDVHLGVLLDGAPAIPVGLVVIPALLLPDVLTAMQEAAPVAEAAESEEAEAERLKEADAARLAEAERRADAARLAIRRSDPAAAPAPAQ
jgi:hypothetical protein